MHHTHFPTIGSTQIYLKKHFAELRKNHSDILISTAEQTDGIGRGENRWDYFDHSIAMSFSLRPNVVPSLTPLEIGILCAKFFKQNFDISINLKWPNDLLNHEHKKCGGIIAQYIDEQAVIAGVGINCGSHKSGNEGSYKHGFSTIESPLLNSMDQESLARNLYSFILTHRINGKELIQNFNQVCAHLNKKVEVEDQIGIFKGIGPSGEAQIEMNGEEKRFFSSSLKMLE